MLVAAGESEALGVGRGLAAVALVVVGLAILVAVSPRTTVAGRSPLDKPPAVLIDRAQQILASVGYTEPIADSAYGFSTRTRHSCAGLRRTNSQYRRAGTCCARVSRRLF